MNRRSFIAMLGLSPLVGLMKPVLGKTRSGITYVPPRKVEDGFVSVWLRGDKDIKTEGVMVSVVGIKTSNDNKRWYQWKAWHQVGSGARLHRTPKARYLSVELLLL